MSRANEVSKGSFFFDHALLPSGWARDVRLETTSSGVISALHVNSKALPDDIKAHVVLPGIANLHSHAFQRGMAALAEKSQRDGDNFWTWREVMFRFATQLEPDDVESIAALAYMEMLERGFTRVGEFHYLHHTAEGRPYSAVGEMATRIVAAASQAKIGLTLLPVLYTRAGFTGGPLHAAQKRFVCTLDGYAAVVDACRALTSVLPDLVVGIAPHSLRAVTPDELHNAVSLVSGGPVHIHAAEQRREVEECRATLGAAPVEWLLANAPVDARWCFVHATHATAAEADLMARTGVVVGLCPVTEGNLGDGVFPLNDFLAHQGAWGVGTDSNVLIGVADELCLLEYAQRLTQTRRNVASAFAARSTGRTLFDAAGQGGAQALGSVWGLAVGHSADFMVLDADNPSLCARQGDDLVDAFIFSSTARAIKDVWRTGEHIVKDGAHIHRAPIEARYVKTLKKLMLQ